MTDPIRQTSAHVDQMAKDWPLIDALMHGTPEMREGGEKWLPKWPLEEQDVYARRVAVATLHPVFKRTVLVNAARPFSRPMKLGDKTPQKVLDWSEDIDLQGTTLAAMAVGLMVCCLSKGLTGILIDYPKAEGVKTVADEKVTGARPYWVHYDANSFLGWKVDKGPHGMQLMQLRLLESVQIDDGEFGTKTIEQVRLLTPGAWAIYRENDKKEWELFESGKTTLDFIPFVFFYGTRKGYGAGCSPLKDLAYQNLEHYQSSSDQQTILGVARVPILFARMFDDGVLAVGAGSIATAQHEKSTLEYVEHTGAAIDAGSKSILDLEDRMRSTGAELISQKTAYTTATQISSEVDSAKSTLQQIVEVFEECLEKALNVTAAWVKEPETAEVELYKDFASGNDTDPATLHTAVEKKTLSRQSAFEELQRRDVISHDRTWEDEQGRIKREANDFPESGPTIPQGRPQVNENIP